MTSVDSYFPLAMQRYSHSLDIKKLISLCLQRDPISEKTLYELYVRPMSGLCLRYVKNEAETKDVLIQGFVKVFENLKKFEYQGEHSLEAWIKRIMVNECLMLLRKKQRHVFIGLTDDQDEPGQVPAPETTIY